MWNDDDNDKMTKQKVKIRFIFILNRLKKKSLFHIFRISLHNATSREGYACSTAYSAVVQIVKPISYIFCVE